MHSDQTFLKKVAAAILAVPHYSVLWAMSLYA